MKGPIPKHTFSQSLSIKYELLNINCQISHCLITLVNSVEHRTLYKMQWRTPGDLVAAGLECLIEAEAVDGDQHFLVQDQ